eukprot:89807-Hanusia_phi.AAC.1
MLGCGGPGSRRRRGRSVRSDPIIESPRRRRGTARSPPGPYCQSRRKAQCHRDTECQCGSRVR